MRFGGYAASGRADPARTYLAAWIDWTAGGLVAILAFPFPIVRHSVPLPVFVGLVVSSLFVGFLLYAGLSAALLGRTPAMYLLDLGFESGPPGVGRSMLWAVVLSACLLPAIVWRRLVDPARGAPAVISGLLIVSARHTAG